MLIDLEHLNSVCFSNENLDATSESFQTRKLFDKLGLTNEIKKAKGEGYQIEYKDLVEKFAQKKLKKNYKTGEKQNLVKWHTILC